MVEDCVISLVAMYSGVKPEDVKPEQVTTADAWINWHGGAAPVPTGSCVEVKQRNGATYYLDSTDDLWRLFGNGYDVIAYRVVRVARPAGW